MTYHCVGCGAVWTETLTRTTVKPFYRFPDWEFRVKAAREANRKLPAFPSRRQQKKIKRTMHYRLPKRMCGDCQPRGVKP